MERISKKQKEEKLYSVGIYARLSVDLDERKKESIDTQIEIGKAFLARQKDMVLYDCYTDMGKSGTNFNREGFERMLRDVRMRKIDCIIVKDLSRFGRNHIETGNYIEKIFPFMGVRFIAVTDNFDSRNVSGDESLGINLKNLVNEMYARDIAMKVKASRKIKWEQGSYTGGVAPYGYRAEWVADRKCLFVEKTTSEIVKKIFGLFLEGKNRKQIVEWLYEERIVRPAEYHKTGNVYCPEEGALSEWSKGSIKMILTNPVYMGHLVQGRSCGKDYMLRERRDMDSQDWSIKEHTHEAIISEELFFEAAKKFEKSSVYCNKKGYSKKIPLDEDIFAEALYCGACGLKMKRISAIKEFASKNRVRTYSYHCPKRNRMNADNCETQSITLHALSHIVKEAIGQELALSCLQKDDLTLINQRQAERLKTAWEEEWQELERKIENGHKLGSEQYLRFRMGEMDEAGFKQIQEENNKKIAAYRKRQEEIAEGLKKTDSETTWGNCFLSARVNEKEESEWSAETVRSLIHRIEIYPDKRVKVIFSFKRKGAV